MPVTIRTVLRGWAGSSAGRPWSPAQWTNLIKTDAARWKKVIDEAGIEVD